MEIVSHNDGLLTNVEVLDHLQNTKNAQKSHVFHADLHNREIIEAQVVKYSRQTSRRNTTTSAQQLCFAKELKKLNIDLTEAEILQVLNECPQHAVEIHLIIEECEDRFTEEQVESMLAVAQKCDQDFA
eukprot:gene3087-6057_t